MPIVSLVLANGPGFPKGSTDHRYEIALTFGAGDQPDVDAWLADPEPWPARRFWPGEDPTEGDVQFDPDGGWSLRIFARPGDAADVPNAQLWLGQDPLRPGQHVTIREPDGAEYVWRVVGLG